MSEFPSDYPAVLEIDYPERERNALTTFFRPVTVIPIAIVLGFVTGGGSTWGDAGGFGGGTQYSIAFSTGGLLFIPPLLMILFRQKYPRWWFDWNRELLRFSNRVGIYLALMDDRYPSTDDHQSVHLDFPYPDAPTQLNRWLPLVKWFLAIPHYVVLAFLYIGAIVVVVIAWFAIVFTGRYPRGMFEYLEGVIRWQVRVAGYAFVLVTDQYPPFRLTA